MSDLRRFNAAIAASQSTRADVRRIITHVVSRTHDCPLLLHGYCRDCPAYLTHRFNEYGFVTQATVEYDYEREHTLAERNAREMLSRYVFIRRPLSPPLRRTRLSDIRPPVEITTHVCPPCTQPHLSEHQCVACDRPHLDGHVCPAPASLPTNVPDPVTVTETSRENPPLPAATWNALQAVIRSSMNAANGTPLFALRTSITSNNLQPNQVISALRPVTTTTTTTEYIPVHPPVDVLPPVEIVPALPPPPSTVLTDPTIAQSIVTVSLSLLSRYPNDTAQPEDWMNTTSTALIARLASGLPPHRINYGLRTAATAISTLLRWSALMHRDEELQRLPHSRPCLYHPCPISYFARHLHRSQPIPNILQDGLRILNLMLIDYHEHLQNHSYTDEFRTEVMTPTDIGYGIPSMEPLTRITRRSSFVPLVHNTQSYTVPVLAADHSDYGPTQESPNRTEVLQAFPVRSIQWG